MLVHRAGSPNARSNRLCRFSDSADFQTVKIYGLGGYSLLLRSDAAFAQRYTNFNKTIPLKEYCSLRLRSLLLSSLFLLPSLPALADTVYTYTGNDFNQLYASSGSTNSYTASDFVSGWFSVSAPLAADLNNAEITPSSFSFSDGVNQFTNSDSSLSIALFEVGTDSNGTITSWYIFLEDAVGGNLITTADGNGLKQDGGEVSFNNSSALADGFIHDPGTWSDPPAAVPEPSSVAFLATGLAGLATIVKRRTLG